MRVPSARFQFFMSSVIRMTHRSRPSLSLRTKMKDHQTNQFIQVMHAVQHPCIKGIEVLPFLAKGVSHSQILPLSLSLSLPSPRLLHFPANHQRGGPGSSGRQAPRFAAEEGGHLLLAGGRAFQVVDPDPSDPGHNRSQQVLS